MIIVYACGGGYGMDCYIPKSKLCFYQNLDKISNEETKRMVDLNLGWMNPVKIEMPEKPLPVVYLLGNSNE